MHHRTQNHHTDVLIIGASAAGAAAALQLGRARRSVVVVDAGEPRNAAAAHMQGYLGHDGLAPTQFLEIAHAELAAYDVVVTPGRIVSVRDDGDRMIATAENGDSYSARRVLLASGLTDVLPEIDGVQEHWGTRVIHCPWCHGWEVRDQRIAVLDTTGLGSHQALLFRQLSDEVTLIRNHRQALTDEELDRLQLGGIMVETRPATAIVEREDRLDVLLNGGGQLGVDVAVVAPRFEPNTAMLGDLAEIADHPSGLGRHVVVDEMGRTSHPKIFAAGNVTDPMQQVLHAAAHGSKIAPMLHIGLINEDIDRAQQSRT